MDPPPTGVERERHYSPSPRSDHTVRCLPPRLGSGEQRDKNRRPLVGSGEDPPHQLLGIAGRFLCNQSLYQTQEQHSRPTTDGQQHCSSLREQNGRHTFTEPVPPGSPPVELVPGEKNPAVGRAVADQESRQVETSSEWMLHKAVFHWTQQILGPCQMDLFATRLNHQLVNYTSWRPDPFAQATDAFRLSWKGLNGYTFPPFGLVGKCLQKIRQEQSTITMVVPQWHSQVWYPTLMECLMDYPLILPKCVDLLRSPSNQLHPLIIQGSLKLLACRVSGNNTLQQGFQKGFRVPTGRVERRDKCSLSVGMGKMESLV